MTIDVTELLLATGWPPAQILGVVALQALLGAALRSGQLRYARGRLLFDGSHRTEGAKLSMRRGEPSAQDWPTGTFLRRLDPAVRRALLDLGVHRTVRNGQILIHEGIQESHLILLEAGLTKVTAALPDGRSALLSLRVGGDLIGEMSALNDKPRSATVTTCGPTRYRVIPRERFSHFLREHPQAALELAAMVSDRLRWSNRRRIDFTSYGVSVRVARVIAELSRTHGRSSRDGVIIDVRLTQPELATICGAAETTIQKALRELRADGLIDIGYRRITVRDLAGLRQLGQLDPEDG
ncbi:Crp/Fnr family transcriptional regulator [Micromonospora yangpuensis]|nr:Crp/Fnr family transcriptional regulator [Micromonospora yangpuensis]GGM02876.1 hypothetical protein GCM10012279_20600 [Micromonospora yangpuensis]